MLLRRGSVSNKAPPCFSASNSSCNFEISDSNRDDLDSRPLIADDRKDRRDNGKAGGKIEDL